MENELRADTRLMHLGEEDKPHGAVTPPIFQNSLFVFPDYDQFTYRDPAMKECHWYSRCTNPTAEIAQRKIADLEGTERAHVFGCGMSAISAAILSQVQSGSHVVAVDTIYGPTKLFLQDYLPKFGVQTTFVRGTCADEVIDAFRPETTLLYLESPSSLLFRLQDLPTLTKYCRDHGVVSAIDNSYSAGVFQKPHALGVDLVLHSATKFLSGHSDITAGVIAGTEAHLSAIFNRELELITGILHPFPSWLLIRGMRTLKLRMRHSEATGHVLADWLAEQPWVERLHHVGRPDFAQKGLRDQQMTGSVSLMSVEPTNQDEDWSRRFVNALRVFQIGVSWGGFESLVAPLTVSPMDYGGGRRMLRFYGGLEDVEDLIDDLRQAAAVAG